jgi:hypothetical protein
VIREQRKILEDTRNNAELLVASNRDGGLEISGRNRKQMEIPKEEKKALVSAIN